MGFMSGDCPRCGNENIGVKTLGSHQQGDGLIYVYAMCMNCNGGFGVIAEPYSRITRAPHDHDGVSFREKFKIIDVLPHPERPVHIEALPPAVQSAFDEAEGVFLAPRRFVGVAGMAYRKALERALKNLHVKDGGLLNARIRKLEKSNALPQAMIDLLDTVRLLGNDAAHEEIDPSVEDVEAARDFTRLFLTYTYELPARIEAALADRK